MKISKSYGYQKKPEPSKLTLKDNYLDKAEQTKKPEVNPVNNTIEESRYNLIGKILENLSNKICL